MISTAKGSGHDDLEARRAMIFRRGEIWKFTIWAEFKRADFVGISEDRSNLAGANPVRPTND